MPSNGAGWISSPYISMVPWNEHMSYDIKLELQSSAVKIRLIDYDRLCMLEL